MYIPGRHEQSGKYRYGFNGMEKDDEVKGEGNHLQFGDFGYSPKIAKRWNIDPVVKIHESPYATFANNPIWFFDNNGLDSTKVGNKWYWRVEKGDSYYSVGKRTKINYQDLQEYNTQDAKELQIGTLLVLSKINVHFVYQSLTPEIYNFTVSNLSKRPDWIKLNYNGGGKAAEANRKLATQKLPPYPDDTRSRDEFPYATTIQGGTNANVFYAPVKEQQIQAGQLGNIMRKMSINDPLYVVPVPNIQNTPVKVPVKQPLVKPVPIVPPIGIPIMIKEPKPVPIPAYIPSFTPLFVIPDLLELIIYPTGKPGNNFI